MSSHPRREHPSTYVVQDRDNQEELTRLQLLDQLFTQNMGGVLSEQPDPTIFKRVLDIGCGTGGWIIEMAKTCPGTAQLFGIDISGKMLDYARAQAEANHTSDRVEFLVMDALRMLEFPNNFFDLVNMRFAQGWIRTWEWPKLLQEARRVTKPGGVIRFIEGNLGHSTSTALNQLHRLNIQAFHQAGNYFTPDVDGITAHLARLMHQHGVRNVQTHNIVTEYRPGTPEGQFFVENTKIAFRVMVPFFKKWIRLPDNYEELYQQALSDIQEPDFVQTGNSVIAWGDK